MLGQVRLVARALLPLVIPLGCSEEGRPPPLDVGRSSTTTTSSGSVTAGVEPCEGPPPPDSAGYCGNEVVPVVTHKPNVYFVLDGSGSMQDDFDGASKLLRAKFAIRDVLAQIGHRIRYGAAVFPDTGEGDVCAVGTQVFPTSEGDSLYCRDPDSEYGPVLRRFLDRIGFRQAGGGTPTAASLSALGPTLRALGPETSIVLITDGAPNCNAGTRCESEQCIPNLEKQAFGELICGDDVDCCDPAVLGPEAYSNCIDDDRSEAVVAELAAAGIRTFVVGMPGSETYATVLNRMALAGGAARTDAETLYYSVLDTNDLSATLSSIGDTVSLSCEVTLDSVPPDSDLLNLYFDSTLVERDDENGWSYRDTQVIELHGQACDVLQGGGVSQIQVVAGCPTIIK